MSAGVSTESGVKPALLEAARQEHIPLAIFYMVVSGVVFTASSAGSKWLIAIYPIGEVLFTRTSVALIAIASFVLPAAGLSVFRTARLGAHAMRALLASDLADDALDRLQHDAARRRDRDHVLLADLLHARLGVFPAREGWPDALDRADRRLPRRAGDRQSRCGHVPDRRAVRARQRHPVRHRDGRGARHAPGRPNC